MAFSTYKHASSVLSLAALLGSLHLPVYAQVAEARITSAVDESVLKLLPNNTHQLARPEFDQGIAPSSLAMDRMLLVLNPSPDREQALELLLKAQQDKSSSKYHQWLTPQQFGQQFGPADADVEKVSVWLESQGFQIGKISNAKNIIEFSGTAGQVEQAFHTEIHKYVVKGVEHWANSSDPQIPAALGPVVAGISTLHNFRKASQIASLQPHAAKLVRGSHGQFTTADGSHALAPGDFATIYNINPLYQTVIDGMGATIAVVARSNINLDDITDFQNAFYLQLSLNPNIVLNGPDPGRVGADETEAVLDVSWAMGVAPEAHVELVVSASTNTTDGVDLSEEYIVDNNLADVMTESYGDCEANFTQAEAQFYSSLAQQAAAQGITFTVAAGDSGAEGCDNPNEVTTANGPVSVNVLASSPYNIAVGGTQFNEGGNAAYWGSSNGYNGFSAQSYIPEVVWNESCAGAQCGNSGPGIWAGGGGSSTLFTKPSWQAGVPGIPNDGARDLPDVAFTSALHDPYLICLDGSCNANPGESYFAGVSGTSAAAPSFAGVMALVVQSTRSRQGQAAQTLYRLAAAENLSSCNASSPASNCVFNDVTSGNNAVPGETGYGSSSANYQAGVGYDRATGLGSVNVSNLVNNWGANDIPAPSIQIEIDSPSAQNSIFTGVTSVYGAVAKPLNTTAAIEISIDSVPYGTANPGLIDIAQNCYYSVSQSCSYWSFQFDTALMANGPHRLDVTAVTSAGQVYTSSSGFTVANWTSANPMRIDIDTPNSQSQPFSGTVDFRGWAIDDQSWVSQVSVAIDSKSYGPASYGALRADVCAVLPSRSGCPNVGWNFPIDTTTLPDGPHTLAITAKSEAGQSTTSSTEFSVVNTPGNPITISIDRPGEGDSFTGAAGFGGWAIGTTAPLSGVAVTIDGVAYGNASYGGNRQDVCNVLQSRPDCPNVGWNFAFDSTQLINGLHVLGIKASTAGGQYVTSSRIFTVSNPVSASAVQIGIDSLSAGNSVLSGPAMFSGWAIDSGSAITSVAVSIDGVTQYGAVYGILRPDICSTAPVTNCHAVGWQYAVDTSQMSNGPHTLTVTAAAFSNCIPGPFPACSAAPNTLSSQFTVANWTTSNPMKLSIDSPSSQSGPLSGHAAIGGWAIDQIAAISKVSVTVDNLFVGAAAYGGSRTDVCAVFSTAAGCPNVGWNFLLDTTLLSDGAHTLAVTGTTDGGRSSTFTTSFQVANGVSSPLRVSIDTPSAAQTLAQISHVGGWALDTSGAQIVSVAVLVDGVLNGVANYGGNRSDVCSVLPSGGGCPNVGWNYELDTTPYANGTHTLDVRALAADGNLYTQSQSFRIANQP